jgi:putative phosphoesterase
MKVLVISDSHGHISNLKHVMGFAKKYKIDAVIHCGDWNTLESVETVLSFGIPLYTVLGNADIHEDVINNLKRMHHSVGKSKNFGEQFLILELGKRKIGITHKPSDNKKFFGGKKLDVIFNGHKHSKDESIVNNVKIIRPGALINGNNFAIYDTDSDKIEFIEDV